MSSAPIRSEKHGSTLVVHLGPEYDSLDDDSLEEVQRFLLGCADVPEARNLVIDLSHTKYFGSAFLEVLFRPYNRIKRKGGKFALSGLQPNPAEVIRVSRLDSIWKLYPTAADAVSGLAESETEGRGGSSG